jgi:hypothetical protein
MCGKIRLVAEGVKGAVLVRTLLSFWGNRVAPQSASLTTDQRPGRNHVAIVLHSPWAFLGLGFVLGILGAWLTLFGAERHVDSVSSALDLENRALAAGETQGAYDALLASMRIAPDDEKVFDASLAFVQQATRSTNDDAFALAEDIHERAANLIPFLPVSRLKSARARHTELAKNLFPTKPTKKPDDPFADSEALLTGALDPHLPTFVRNRLLHDAELELGNQATRIAVLPKASQDQDRFWSHWKTAKSRYDEAQSALLSSLYREDCQPRMHAWVKTADGILAEAPKEDPGPTDQQSERIRDLVAQGQRLERELSSYVEGGVEAATKETGRDALSRRIVQLSELREWNYNRWALTQVTQVEGNGTAGFESLRVLAPIDETRLSAYVGQRLAEAWKKAFDACSTEDKVEATKLRVRREYQQ